MSERISLQAFEVLLVLASSIQQVDLVLGKSGILAITSRVVNNGGIFSHGRNRAERDATEELFGVLAKKNQNLSSTTPFMDKSSLF